MNLCAALAFRSPRCRTERQASATEARLSLLPRRSRPRASATRAQTSACARTPSTAAAAGSVPLARLRNRPGSELGEWHRMSAPAMVLVAAEAITTEGPPAPNARLLDADADADAAQRLLIQVREYLCVELNAFSVCLRRRMCTIFAYFVSYTISCTCIGRKRSLVEGNAGRVAGRRCLCL